METRDKKVYREYNGTYKGHGTLNLFAALEVATGHVHIETTSKKKERCTGRHNENPIPFKLRKQRCEVANFGI